MLLWRHLRFPLTSLHLIEKDSAMFYFLYGNVHLPGEHLSFIFYIGLIFFTLLLQKGHCWQVAPREVGKKNMISSCSPSSSYGVKCLFIPRIWPVLLTLPCLWVVIKRDPEDSRKHRLPFSHQMQPSNKDLNCVCFWNSTLSFTAIFFLIKRCHNAPHWSKCIGKFILLYMGSPNLFHNAMRLIV